MVEKELTSHEAYLIIKEKFQRETNAKTVTCCRCGNPVTILDQEKMNHCNTCGMEVPGYV